MIERSASILPGQGKVAAIALNGVVARDSAFSLDRIVNAVPTPPFYNTAASDRHGFADSGKAMPQTTSQSHSDEDDDRADDRGQAVSIWLPVPIAAVQTVDRLAPTAQNASIAIGRSTATLGAASSPTPELTIARDPGETGVAPDGAKNGSASPQGDTQGGREASAVGAEPPTIGGQQPAPSTAADLSASRPLGLEPPAPQPVGPDAAKNVTPSATISSISVGKPIPSAPFVFVDAKFSLPGAPAKSASSGESAVDGQAIGVAIDVSVPSPLSSGPSIPAVVSPAVDPSESPPIAPTTAASTDLLLEQKAAAAAGNVAPLTNTPLPQFPNATATPLAPRHGAMANELDITAPLPNRAGGDDAGDDSPLSAPATTPMTASIATAVAASTGAHRVPLNLAADTGLQRMIDHIELLRDDADSRDTRIRLSPDALGTVDVAVRKLGDSVHVHFTAHHDATRLALANAHQRLTDLATARGVKLSGSSVDIASQSSGNQGGASQNGSGNSTFTPQSAVARSSSSVARSDPASITESTNQRLA